MLLLPSFIISVVGASLPDTTVLNAFPMIMAHDSATSYLKPGGPISKEVFAWAKTQPDGGLAKLAQCGARAFDWRPSMKNGVVEMHHGPIDIPYKMSDAMDELVAWCASSSDLVVLGVTDCAGDHCANATMKLLAGKNISYITQCDELKGMTVAAAKARSALPGGGHLLAIFDCWDMHFNDTIACRGFGGKPDAAGPVTHPGTTTVVKSEALSYSCWNTSTTKQGPLNEMFSYLDRVAAAGPNRTSGKLYTAQALWQETTEAIVLGGLAGSSLIDDEVQSQLNALVTARLASFTNVNLIEINNVCDGGPALYAEMQARDDMTSGSLSVA